MTGGRSTLQGLLARLPEYLVPATTTVLDRLPPRASGTLDRDAMPSPRPVSPAPGGAGSVAETVAVQLVAQVQQNLGIDAYTSVPGRTRGWSIQAKGSLIQLRPTGRDELTE